MKVTVHGAHDVGNSLAGRRDRPQNGWRPRRLVAFGCLTSGAGGIHRELFVARHRSAEVDPVMCGDILERVAAAESEHQLKLMAQAVGPWPVGLVHDKDVGDLHQAGLERLDRVPRFRDQHDDAAVRGARNVELTLSDTNRLDKYLLNTEGIEDVGDFSRRRGETAKRPTRRHRTDEDAGIEGDGLHTNPIAEERSTGKWRGRIDGNNTHRLSSRTVGGNECRGQCALPGTGRTGNTDAPRPTKARMKCREQELEAPAVIFDDANGSRQGGPFPAVAGRG